MPDRKRLFLIDGSALFYRSYFAFIRNPLFNSKGENTGAVYGFANSLMKILSEENPDYIVAAFDTKEPTFRHEKFKEYKATREKMPDEMAEQFPRIVQLVEAFNIPVIEKPGFEADDVIGTLARKAEEKAIESFMVTGDKDFMQLLSPLIKMYVIRSAKDAEIYDLAVLEDKFGITPQQVIDYMALMGDSSDNIPGVKGVGAVTAKKLLNKFQNLDNIYNNLDKVEKKSDYKKLAENKENAYLSRELVTIDTKVNLEMDIEKMKIEPADPQKLLEIFEVIESTSLIQRIPEFTKGNKAGMKTIESIEKNYQLMNTFKKLDALVDMLEKSEFFVFDTETTGLRIFDSEIIGISFCLEPSKSFYVPLMGSVEYTQSEALNKLRPIFESDDIKKGAQNIKFDGLMLWQHKIELKGIGFDTMIAHYLLNPGTRQHNLDFMAQSYLNYKMIPIEDLIGKKGKNQKKMQNLDPEKIYQYACEDADITLRLKEILANHLVDSQLIELFKEMEMPLVEVLMQMEKNGVKIDVEFMKKMSDELASDIERLEHEIYDMANGSFNINSPQQLGKILFDQLEIHKELGNRRPTKTATGQYSTAESVLEKFSGHPIVEKILEYRKLIKLKSTYVDALPLLVSKRTGRLHTSFNQTVAATGRLSSSEPNLQNIPIRTDIGRKIRRAFVAEDQDDLIMSADYSQIELRIMAHLSGDDGLKKAFQRNEDIHASTAAAIFNIPIEMVNPDHRRKAKEVNFGIIYGISQYGLANRLGISPEEAQEIIQSYFTRFPRVNDYMIHTITFANQNKYVTTLKNRRRYLPEIDSKNATVRQNAERMAINTTIQGSAADLIKLAMIRIQKQLTEKKLQTKMLLQVHDELIFEVKAPELETVKKLVKNKMENAIQLDVPIKAEVGVAKNWLDAH